MTQHGRLGLLQALVDPTEPAVRTGRDRLPSLERALALLIDARFAEYQATATQAGWPNIGESVERDASPGSRLLSSISLQLGGASAAANQLAVLAADQWSPIRIRVLAAIFSAIAFRDAGRPDRASDVLTHFRGGTAEERALLLLHRAVSQREMGNAGAALSLSLAAQEALAVRPDLSVIGRVLATISARNIHAFAFAAGRNDLLTRLSPRSEALERIESRTEQGLSSWLDQEFEGRLQDPSQTTMSFRQEDPIETPLIASLLRAEALADWFLTNDTRRRLGRYQLLASVGVPERAPVPAMFLLRRAADTKGLRQALRWYVGEGPLKAVRDFGDAIATSGWSAVTLQTDLVAMAETADLMSQQAADAALTRILANLEVLFRGTPGSRIESETNSAVAALLAVAPGSSADVAARYFEAVTSSSDPLLLQSVGRVFGQIDWAAVDREVLERWRQYAVDHLAGSDDHRFSAAELIRALPDRGQLQPDAAEAFQDQPDILAAINVLALGPVDRPTAHAIARIARDDLRRARDEAAKGTHGFGQYVDVPLLLTHLLMEHPKIGGWADLAGFLEDPNVAASRKVGPLREILRRPESVPQFIHERIATWAGRAVQYNQLPFDPIDAFKGAVLRVRLRYQAKPAADLMAELLEMATGTNRAARREAAASLPIAADAVPLATLLTLSLTLSRDAAAEVRGAAARSLPLIASAVSEPLASVAWARVEELLREESVQVPLWAMSGLAEREPSEIPSNVRATIEWLAVSHLSRQVRTSASKLTVGNGSVGAGFVLAPATSPGAASSN
jgi:hypothetical protein